MFEAVSNHCIPILEVESLLPNLAGALCSAIQMVRPRAFGKPRTEQLLLRTHPLYLQYKLLQSKDPHEASRPRVALGLERSKAILCTMRSIRFVPSCRRKSSLGELPPSWLHLSRHPSPSAGSFSAHGCREQRRGMGPLTRVRSLCLGTGSF